MEILRSVCCLLVTTHFAFFVNCDLIFKSPDNVENIEKQKVDDRWKLEVGDFPSGLRVKNDKGELIELTDEDVPPKGSESRSIGGKVLFQLYTTRNPTEHQPLTIYRYSFEDLQASNFNKSKPTVFITHGWVTNGASASCTLIRDAYLRSNDVNVIIVDWSAISMSPYQWASKQVVRVGREVAEMINYLKSNAGLDTGRTTLVGHSLGAHVMGIAGYFTHGVVNRIIGLDPAYPMFKYALPGSRISHYDAKHVQIIHTNSGLLGYPNALGHTDFYPNGGSSQLGCTFDLGGSCSHSRAIELYAESLITPKGFLGKPCISAMDFLLSRCRGRNFAVMGGSNPNPRLRGIFYLWTNDKPPYAIGNAV